MTAHRVRIEVTPGSTAPSITLGSKKHCRFCGRHPGQVAFKKIAHVIPQSLSASQEVLTREECDECNENASVHEQDLASFLAPPRLECMMRGSKRTVRVIPALAASAAERHVDVQLSDSLDELSILPGRVGYLLNLPMHFFRWSGIARAVLRMGLFVAPRELLTTLAAPALQWLKDPSCVCPVTFSYDDAVPPIPTAQLLVDWIDTPGDLVGRVRFTYGTHQITIGVWRDHGRSHATQIEPDGGLNLNARMSFEFHLAPPFLPPTDSDVAATAYVLWERRGKPTSGALQDWLLAEKMVLLDRLLEPKGGRFCDRGEGST